MDATAEPLFLTLDEVLQIHADMIDRYGGEGAVRDLGLVESAVMQPQMSFGGQSLYPDLPAMAATYLFHLAKNHGFVDGNKRTGAAAAVVFLKLNGVRLRPDEEGLERLTLRVAAGEAKHEEVAEFFREGVEPEA